MSPRHTAIGSILLRGALLAFACCAAARAATPAPAPVINAWVVLGPEGAQVRAITEAATCPRVATVSERGARPRQWSAAMTLRQGPQPDYPNRVCEWRPAPAARFVAVEGLAATLAMPVADPRRIVVIGDTGCLGGSDQDCAGPWYFADLARHAAMRAPDLVIHLGDYNYRGTNCTAFDGCCTYDPSICGFPNCGDTWPMWQADFFAPAAPLLATAPWVVVRGNHELCSRAGRGFHRYLDPHTPPPRCNANPVEQPLFGEPYALPLGPELRLLVFDSAAACDQQFAGSAAQIAAYEKQFARLDALAAAGSAAQTWLLVHRPLWGIVRDVAERATLLNYTLEQASRNKLPPTVSLVLSGHEHLFQSLSFAGQSRPPSLLVGTGGVELDDPSQVPLRLTNVPVSPGITIFEALTIHDHGYLLIERNTRSWTGTFFDRYDQALATCDSSEKVVCTRVPPP